MLPNERPSMKNQRLCLLLLTINCLAISACAIGPQVETRTVVVYPGQPLQILQNVTVTGRRMNDETQVQQDIGGWVCMPRAHFDALARAANLESTNLGTTP